MASHAESCEGSGLRSDKASNFQKENSPESRNTSTKPSLRPIVTCSSPYSSSSFSSSCSSASSSPCSVFGVSKSVENGSKADNLDSISSVCADTDVSCSSEEICTTPKANEYRIPEFLTCPPAPRKRRARSRFLSVPLTGFFVVSPDLDSMFSMHKIPVNM